MTKTLMMRGSLLILAFFLPPAARAGEDSALSKELAALTTGFHGAAGVYARRLATGRWAAVNPDEVFPTASMIKTAILIGVFDRISSGTLDYNQQFRYDQSRRDPLDDGDILESFKDSEPVTTAQLVWLMASMSDNTAALWLQELAGGGSAINAWLEARGFKETRVNSRTPGREEDRKKNGWGQTTPREIANLMAMIREGKAVSPAASEEMFRVLSRSYWDGEAVSELPPSVHVASKQGMVDHSRSEVLLVSAPLGDYVLAVITKDQADTSYQRDNAGYRLLRGVSAAVWKRWGGKPWTPAPGAERFHKDE